MSVAAFVVALTVFSGLGLQALSGTGSPLVAQGGAADASSAGDAVHAADALQQAAADATAFDEPQVPIKEGQPILPVRFEVGPDGVLRTAGSAVSARFLPGEVRIVAAGAPDVVLSLPSDSKPELGEPTGSWSNYVYGNDPAQWREGVAHHALVRYPDVRPGLDVLLRTQGPAFRLEVEADPGVDASALRIQVRGATPAVSEDGSLTLSAGNPLTLPAPVAFQPTGAARQPVEVSFAVEGTSFGFDVGETDPSLPLVIDPLVAYATFYGGTGSDQITDIERDNAGIVFIAGVTRSADLPNTRVMPSQQEDVFLAKFSVGGTVLFATYLGGGKVDGIGFGAFDEEPTVRLAVRDDGVHDDVVVAGSTESRDFPIVNGFQPIHGGGRRDFFVAFVKTGPADNGFPYFSTFHGGPATENLRDMTLGLDDEIVTVGDSDDLGSPVAGNAYQFSPGSYVKPVPPPPPNSPPQPPPGPSPTVDVYLMTMDDAGAGWTYATYLGDTGEDRGYGVAALDTKTYAIVGRSVAVSEDEVPNPPRNNYPMKYPYETLTAEGDTEPFATILDTSKGGAAALVFSTFFGGNYWDTGDDVLAVEGTVPTGGGPPALKFTMLGRTQGFPQAYLDNPLLPSNAYGYHGGVPGGPDKSNDPYNQYDGGPQPNATGDDDDETAPLDLFLATFEGPYPPDPAEGPTLVASTYLGGEADEGPGEVVQAGTKLAVAARSDSSLYPLTSNRAMADQNVGDGVLTVLEPDHQGFVYSTYVGDKDTDLLRAAHARDQDDICVAGASTSKSILGLDKSSSVQFTNAGNPDDGLVLCWMQGGPPPDVPPGAVPPPPFLGFTYTPEGPCVGDEMLFINTSVFDPERLPLLSRTWDFHDGFPPADDGERMYTEGGSWPVTMRIVDALGSVWTVTRAIYICEEQDPDLSGHPGYRDSDGDGWADAYDICPDVPNRGQEDIDANGIGDACDDMKLRPASSDSGVVVDDPTAPADRRPIDSDRDGIVDPSDNCVAVPNRSQADQDLDEVGDVCDDDRDGDMVPQTSPDPNATLDNCPLIPNPEQRDRDGDRQGDACDDDGSLLGGNVCGRDCLRARSNGNGGFTEGLANVTFLGIGLLGGAAVFGALAVLILRPRRRAEDEIHEE